MVRYSLKEIMTKQTKNTGDEAIVEQFKPKKSNIDIFYELGTWDDVLDKSVDKTISYRDIKGYSLNGPYLVVQLHDDTQYVYPMANVTSLKLFVTE